VPSLFWLRNPAMCVCEVASRFHCSRVSWLFSCPVQVHNIPEASTMSGLMEIGNSGRPGHVLRFVAWTEPAQPVSLGVWICVVLLSRCVHVCNDVLSVVVCVVLGGIVAPVICDPWFESIFCSSFVFVLQTPGAGV
jgi:hypothetical protein